MNLLKLGGKNVKKEKRMPKNTPRYGLRYKLKGDKKHTILWFKTEAEQNRKFEEVFNTGRYTILLKI